MSDKKPATMDEFLKISQSKRAQDGKEKKKKEKDKDKGKPKEPAAKKPAAKKEAEPAESAAQPSSRDIFALLEETDTEAQNKIKGKILDVVQGLVQAYGEIPISRIVKRIPDETEERVVSVIEDLIIAGAIKARLSTDKIIPMEGTSKISIDKSLAKGKLGSGAPAMAAEITQPEAQKPAGRSKAGPPEAPRLVAPSLAEPPSFTPQKGAGKGMVPSPRAPPRAPSIPTIPEPPSLSIPRGKQPVLQVEEMEIPDFPNPEPSESGMEEIPTPAPMEQEEAPEPANLEDIEAVPAPPMVPVPRPIQKPAAGMKPVLKPMKMPAPKPAGVPVKAMQKPVAPKMAAVQKPVVPKMAAIQKPAAQKVPAITKPVGPRVPQVPPVVPSLPAKPSIKPAPGMKPVKPAQAPAAHKVPAVPQVPRIAAPSPAKPVKPMSKEDQAALFEQKVNEMLQDRPEELSLVYKLFENPKLALLGFDEDWISGAMGITAEHAVELIKYLRGLNIVKLGPSGLNFVINTNL